MNRICFILTLNFFSVFGYTQAMLASFHPVNYLPNFITAGMRVRYEVSNSSCYSGTGTILTDLMGNVNATLYGSPTYTNTGVKNINFSSASSQFVLTNNIGTSNYESCFMWVYLTGNGIILSELGQGNINTAWHDSQIELVSGTLKFGVWPYSNGSPLISSSISTPLNAWYYIGFTYNGTTLTAYVNGSVAGTATITRNAPSNLYYGIGAIDGTNLGNGGYGNFKLRSFHYYNRALTTNEVKLNYTSMNLAPDGTTSSTASTSAYQIKQDYPNSADGFYWIKNASINGGNPFKIYADMTTDGGGWTLIMKNSNASGWTYANAISLNTSMPFTSNADITSTSTANYSIIGWADYIKKSSSGFQYMIDATSRRSFGGIWTANGSYSFIKTDNSQTNVTLNTKFGTWNYVAENGIMQRMPWYSSVAGSGCGVITTDNGSGNWWGTMISLCSGWTPTPWIYDAGGGTSDPNPGIMWYWVR